MGTGEKITTKLASIRPSDSVDKTVFCLIYIITESDDYWKLAVAAAAAAAAS